MLCSYIYERMICPNCNTQNIPNKANFCPNCGHQFVLGSVEIVVTPIWEEKDKQAQLTGIIASLQQPMHRLILILETRT